MRRYVVRNHRSGTSERFCATLGEAVAAAIRLIDEGIDADVMDTQGSGQLMVDHFVLREAEAYLRRSLGSETQDRPQPLTAVLAAAKKRGKEEATIYHWDYGDSDIR
jgi:hypothetical protein